MARISILSCGDIPELGVAENWVESTQFLTANLAHFLNILDFLVDFC
jgi:hypothetical protein